MILKSFERQYATSFLLVINSNLGPILHPLTTVHLWPTDNDNRAIDVLYSIAVTRQKAITNLLN